MPISAQMSVWGLYQIDPTILDGLHLPEAVDRETLVDNLLLETESLEVLYPSPAFLKKAVEVWSKERLPIWEKLYETTILEYNPIENYDRIETGTNTASGESSGENESTSSATAYDSNEFSDTGKGVSSGSNTFENTGTFNTRVHGNIGVTTSQQMIEAQREVVKFCLTGYIIEEFTQRFCVGVY